MPAYIWLPIICIAVLTCIYLLWRCCKRKPNETKKDVENCQSEPLLLEQIEEESVELNEVECSENFNQQPSLLSVELTKYYKRHVHIPASKLKSASAVAGKIKSNLLKFIKMDSKTTFDFGKIMCQGSSYEGLKVAEPDEFDFLLPLILEDNVWNTEPGRNYGSPGYVYVKKLENRTTPYDNAIVKQVYLSPIDVRRKMQSIIHRVLKKIMDSCNVHITIRESGPALTLVVTYDHTCEMKIDIVPSISIRNKLLVAKRHPESDLYQCRTENNMFNNLWRVSFSQEEISMIRKMDGNNECPRALKILKTIRLRKGKSFPLNMLSSYHLKICMLHLFSDDRHNNITLDNCFKDLLRKLIQYLEDAKLPHYFDPTVDLFSAENEIELQKVGHWLNKLISSDDEIIKEMLN